MKLFVLNSKPADPNGYIAQALFRALARQYQHELIQLDPLDIGQVPVDPEGQALFVYGGEELQRIPSQLLQAPFSRRAVWFTEDPYEFTRNFEQASLFTNVFSNDSGSVAAYLEAKHLPLAADADLLPLLQRRSLTRLAFFSGTAWPNRKRLLHGLHHSFKDCVDLDIHLVKNDVVENTALERGLGRGLCFSPPIPINEFTLRAARSVCTLVIGRSFSGSGKHVYSRSPGPRLFEAGLTGSCQLVHAGEISDMPADLLEGEHYLRFHDLDELCSLLQQARSNSQRFKAIGTAMADRIRSHHTYDQRARELLDSLIPRNAEPIRLLKKSLSALRVLFISHEQIRPGFQFGGAGICLQQILSTAPAHAQIRVLCRAGDDGQRFDLFDGAGKVVGGFRCSKPVDQYSLTSPEFEHYFEKLLSGWMPSLVHVNHLLGFIPAVLPLARRIGSRVVFTLHDYFTLCDSWNLLDDQNVYCGINDFFYSRCQSCSEKRLPQFSRVQPFERRVLMAEAIIHAHQLIVPSAAAEAQLRKVFPHLPQTEVIEPVPEAACESFSVASGDELVVLIAGNLSPNKGSDDLLAIVKEVELLDLPIRFRVIGRIDPPIRRELVDFTHVDIVGSYEPGEFSAMADFCDLAMFLSPWPETYCITFDEWIFSGRACFFVAIGALKEAHRHRLLHPASRSFEPGSIDVVLPALIQAATPQGLDQLRRPSSFILQTGSNTTDINDYARTEFGEHHWKLFAQVLANPLPCRPIPWKIKAGDLWVDSAGSLKVVDDNFKRRLRNFVYSLPAGHRLARRLRQLRG